MRQKYFYARSSKIAFLLDAVAVTLSLSIAIGVRLQFKGFFFVLSTTTALFPITLLLRILSLFLFDSYAMSFTTFLNKDLQRIILINLLPSFLLLILRLVSPIVNLRMPISIIIIEYIATTLGFILVRTFLHSRLVARTKAVGHRKKILLWGEVADIRESIAKMRESSELNRQDLIGILSPNALYWQTEHFGLRVYGNETILKELVAADDRMCALCFLNPHELTRTAIGKIVPLLDELNMQAGIWSDTGFELISPKQLAVTLIESET